VPARVVPQQSRAAEPAAEIEVEDAVARAARRETVQLDDRVAALVAQLDAELGARHCEGVHREFS
jgi:hypothetical protein